MAKAVKQSNTTQKVIGENTFYIRPFPAFTAANISGDLVKLLSPVVGGIASAIGASGTIGDTASGFKEAAAGVMDMDIEDVAPKLSDALSGLSGDAVERMMRKLLVNNRNISVEGPATDGEVKWLDNDIANEVFCAELQDMYILCFEVIRVNFKGFFSKIAGLFGDRQEGLEAETASSDTDI